MSSQQQEKNIIVGPDYGQMIKQQTNSTIVEAFITMLFNKNTKFNFVTLLALSRNMVILLIIKLILEESKTYLDKFKFTNTDFFKYLFQKIKLSTKTYTVHRVSGKWAHVENDTQIVLSEQPFINFYEQKGVYVTKPNNYYYYVYGYLIKVAVSENKIDFNGPDVTQFHNHMSEVFTKNREIIHGTGTTVHRILSMPSGVIKIESLSLSYAFNTYNYKSLKNPLKDFSQLTLF